MASVVRMRPPPLPDIAANIESCVDLLSDGRNEAGIGSRAVRCAASSSTSIMWKLRWCRSMCVHKLSKRTALSGFSDLSADILTKGSVQPCSRHSHVKPPMSK